MWTREHSLVYAKQTCYLIKIVESRDCNRILIISHISQAYYYYAGNVPQGFVSICGEHLESRDYTWCCFCDRSEAGLKRGVKKFKCPHGVCFETVPSEVVGSARSVMLIGRNHLHGWALLCTQRTTFLTSSNSKTSCFWCRKENFTARLLPRIVNGEWSRASTSGRLSV